MPLILILFATEVKISKPHVNIFSTVSVILTKDHLLKVINGIDTSIIVKSDSETTEVFYGKSSLNKTIGTHILKATIDLLLETKDTLS